MFSIVGIDSINRSVVDTRMHLGIRKEDKKNMIFIFAAMKC